MSDAIVVEGEGFNLRGFGGRSTSREYVVDGFIALWQMEESASSSSMYSGEGRGTAR